MRKYLFLAILLLLLPACQDEEVKITTPQQAMKIVPPADWPLLEDDMDIQSLTAAAAYSLDYLARRPPDEVIVYGPHTYRPAELARAWQRVLELRQLHPQPQDFTGALKSEFMLLQAVGQNGKDGNVLFTGYYEPIIAGRLQAEAGFSQPLYAVPDDMLTVDLSLFGQDLPARRLVGRIQGSRLVPYPDREAIDFDGVINQSAKALAYIADPVDAFFMHIQGSGQIVLKDGQHIRIGYAAQNGHPYRSIGALLIREGHMPSHEMSMQNLKAWLSANPEQRRRILSQNPSYIFFRLLPAEGGPSGAYGRPVTAGRSIAYDRGLFPPMGLAFIKGSRPGPDNEDVGLSRLVWGQDTGGAIKGPGRLDLFFGSGEKAGLMAGRMKHIGQMYFLAPK